MIGRGAISHGAALAGAVLLMTAAPALADLSLPAGAQALAQRDTPLGTYALPVGPAAADGVPVRTLEGRILRRTWKIQGGSTVLQILAPLREQLLDDGYEAVFQCETRLCGGFDFRFGIEVVPAPDMAVNIGNYHFLSMVKGDGALSLLVSRSGSMNYLQLIEVTPEETPPVETVQPVGADPVPAPAVDKSQEAGSAPRALKEQLLSEGHAILGDLDFGSGAIALGQESYGSLTALAAFLAEHPEYSVVVVGHTDTVGGLEDNTRLSQRRAQAVKDHLVQNAGVADERIAVEGAGYLAPIASNLTAEGREANRRVEVVLLPRERP